MGPVDLQQTLRRCDGSDRLMCSRNSASATLSGTVAQALPLGGQPHIEVVIDADQVFQQFAIQQRQGAAGSAVVAHMTSSTSTHTAPGFSDK